MRTVILRPVQALTRATEIYSKPVRLEDIAFQALLASAEARVVLDAQWIQACITRPTMDTRFGLDGGMCRNNTCAY